MRTLLLGLDAFDPTVFERLSDQGKMPSLTEYVNNGGYARFSVANPPQSEVSWTSIATGLNPGGHGIFDFIHRNPATYTLNLSLLPTKRGFTGTQFVPPHSASTIFDEVVRQGFPATVLWWPATFPAQPGSPVRTLPGLGTPDLLGRLGVGTLFSTNTDLIDKDSKTPVIPLNRSGKGRYTGRLIGPIRKTRKGGRESSLEFQLDLTGDKSARLKIGKQLIELTEGSWSPFLELSFKMGFFVSVHALTRVIISQMQPEIKLYFLPFQIHPLRSPWRYATPPGFVKQTWKAAGPFPTLGWPQDTTGLEDQCITDDQFLKLCASIVNTREQILMYQLQNFQEGVLASVFDSLDRIQHMFWRDRPDVIEEWYMKLDGLVGRVQERLVKLDEKNKTRLVIVSDHGFSDFNYKVHLNRWLIEQGYLVTKDNGASKELSGVDWSQSQAYAIGLNSIYLNLAEREGQGCVQAGQKEQVMSKLQAELLDWQGPDGQPLVKNLQRQDEAFEGPLTPYGPDIVVGFSPGYRASAQTGLGQWRETSIESNNDHWGADHCIAPEAVPGVIFSNQDLSNFSQPSYRDIPALTIGAMPEQDKSGSPPTYYSNEDKEVIEERLKSLGYL